MYCKPEYPYAYAVYQCPKASCRRLFISTFKYDTGPSVFMLRSSSPWDPIKHEFPEEVTSISPSFCSIYDESFEAEQRGLVQICGAGYRKALEFLIKDYLIKEVNVDPDIVKDKLLGACINDHVDDERIKACAKRAAWLGNDETHYYRKWAEKDYEDLKKLIVMTVNWIQNVYVTNELIDDMPKGK